MVNLLVKDARPARELSYLHSMETMGQRIRQLRNSKKLTQLQLAKLLSVTKGAVSQWEAGDIANPKLHTALRLCEVLGTDIAYLVYGPGRKPSTVTTFPTSETGQHRLLRRKGDNKP